MPTWDIFRIKRGDNSVVTTCHTRVEALQWLEYHKKLVTPDMFVVNIRGTIIYTQPNYGTKTLQRKSPEDTRRPRASEEQRRDTDSVLRPKALQTSTEGRPQW